MMNSPLVRRLSSDLVIETDSEKRAILLAELACYWARVGEFDKAQSLRFELRKEFGDGRSLKVSVLTMLLEGVLHFFNNVGQEARDRIVRAQFLSSTFGDMKLLSLTSSWLAHIDFNLCQFESMTKALESSISNFGFDNGTAECRVALVLGDAFLFSNQRTPSQAWYERARRTATKLGDQAAIGAITYNRAALRVANLRLQRLTCTVDQSEIQMVDGEVRTAVNYQAVADLRSREHWLGAAQVGVHMLASRFDAALTTIDALLASGAAPQNSGEELLLICDRFECLTRLDIGPHDADSMHESIKAVEARGDPDDKSLAYAALASSARLLGRSELADELKVSSDISLANHRAIVDKLTTLIAPFKDLAGT